MSGVPDWADEARSTGEPQDADFTEIKPKPVRLPVKKPGTDVIAIIPQVMAWGATNEKSEEEVREQVTNMSVSDYLDRIGSERNDLFTGAFKREINNGEAVARVLLNKALAGDMSALREYLNRTEGKVPNRTINQSSTMQVKGTMSDLGSLMAKIDANNPQKIEK